MGELGMFTRPFGFAQTFERVEGIVAAASGAAGFVVI